MSAQYHRGTLDNPNGMLHSRTSRIQRTVMSLSMRKWTSSEITSGPNRASAGYFTHMSVIHDVDGRDFYSLAVIVPIVFIREESGKK